MQPDPDRARQLRERGSVISLTQHRNTRERQKQRELRKTLKDWRAQDANSFDKIEGFVVITWGDGGQSVASWHVPESTTLDALPHNAAEAIRRQITRIDTSE